MLGVSLTCGSVTDCERDQEMDSEERFAIRNVETISL